LPVKLGLACANRWAAASVVCKMVFLFGAFLYDGIGATCSADKRAIVMGCFLCIHVSLLDDAEGPATQKSEASRFSGMALLVRW
jgi:hypothetical protein